MANELTTFIERVSLTVAAIAKMTAAEKIGEAMRRQ